jgi:hypothetical protein
MKKYVVLLLIFIPFFALAGVTLVFYRSGNLLCSGDISGKMTICRQGANIISCNGISVVNQCGVGKSFVCPPTGAGYCLN